MSEVRETMPAPKEKSKHISVDVTNELYKAS
jgi:hypothetical protein